MTDKRLVGVTLFYIKLMEGKSQFISGLEKQHFLFFEL